MSLHNRPQLASRHPRVRCASVSHTPHTAADLPSRLVESIETSRLPTRAYSRAAVGYQPIHISIRHVSHYQSTIFETLRWSLARRNYKVSVTSMYAKKNPRYEGNLRMLSPSDCFRMLLDFGRRSCTSTYSTKDL